MTPSSRAAQRRRRASTQRGYTHARLSTVVLCWLVAAVQAQEQPQANSLLDALWKFQETLRNHVEGTPPNNNADADFRSSLEQQSAAAAAAADIQKRKRKVSHRRGLFEHTLTTHYSRFVPDLEPPENVQRSVRGVIKESWIDDKSGCSVYREDGTSYWTYEWCPKRGISQKPADQKIVNNLGRFESNKNVIRTQFRTFSYLNGDEEVEYYTNGDYCYPSQDKQLRTKVRRRAIIVYEDKPCIDNQEFAIVRVTEPQPCHYLVAVCRSTEEFVEEQSEEAMASEEGEATLEDEARKLQLIQDVQEVIAAYAKTTGLDQANMEKADRATASYDALPPLPPSRRKANLDLLREMFTHSYDSYMYHAYPESEVKPLTCRPGTFDLVKLPALTLVDSLDTLAVMRNFTEFARGVERLRDLHLSMQYADNGSGKKIPIIDGGLFSTNTNVSLFETNIRVLGGLLSAHQLAVAYLENQVPLEQVRENKKGAVLIGPVVAVAEVPCSSTKSDVKGEAPTPICPPLAEGAVAEECVLKNAAAAAQGFTQGSKHTKDQQACENGTDTKSSNSYWTYDGFLLDLAHDLGKRMAPAFDTKTGIPYGTVNLVDGIPNGESKVASLAGAGTLSLEFELLSRLTGDESFGDKAKLAARALWMRRSKKDLLGKHIHIEKGTWTEHLSGIGSNSDSFYEYLVKHYLLFPEDEDFWPMFVTSYGGIHNESRIGEWYADVDMNVGAAGAQRRIFESLMAFYPGMQVLLGEITPAAKSLNGFFMVREAVGLLPERYNFGQWKVDNGGGLHPLRPELLESCYFLHKATEGMTLSRTNQTAGTSGWLWAADYALHTLHWYTWAECGYAAINVSPQVTGGVPSGQAKRPRPQAVNEMPSFFLSETLKYLFLTFDDNNILHQDDDRDWVFTTEAHPIHHVPVEKSNGDSEKEKLRLQQRVKDLLEKRANRRRVSMMEPRSYLPDVDDEKWAEKSSASDFVNQVIYTEKRMGATFEEQLLIPKEGHELFSLDIIQPSFLPLVGDGDELSAMKQEPTNVAHLGLTPSGPGLHAMAAMKSCPNIYSPSLGWINALNGGNTDYSNVYVSSIVDEIPVDMKYGVGLLSASHALALHGSGMFLGRNQPSAGGTCSISNHGAGSSSKQEKPGTPEGSQRFDMGGTLGAFDVSVYAEGNGFFIKQVNTGETVVVTAIHDDRMIVGEGEVESSSPFVMVYASTPPRSKRRSTAQKTPQASPSSWLPGMNWKSVFTREPSSEFDETDDDDSTTSRSITVGDSSGKAFSCDVQIVTRSVEDFSHLSPYPVYPIETETIVRSFPCAPALFGPTMIPRLAASNGITAEGFLTSPDSENERGCDSVDETGYERPNGHVQLVERGECTFQTKAANQKENGASAVIVINSDSEELFLMAHGADTESDDNFPVTTLVSGNDAAELLTALEDAVPEPVLAKVVLAPQSIRVDETGTIHSLGDELRFPILQASTEAIQIYASGGWGVHAMERPIEQATTSDTVVKKEWQLYLLQHSQINN